MVGLGTIVNVAAIIIGSLLGLAIGHKLPERIHNLLVKVIGLFTVAIGIKLFFKSENLLIVLLSLVIGGIIGELLNIEKRLESFGKMIKSIVRTDSKTFLDGFVTSSLLYCVGPMAILGAISDGISGQHDILYAKSILDGTVSVGFATTLGIGVLFSSIPVLIYQGIITILAMFLGRVFLGPMIAELTATGGLLIAGIGINLLGVLGNDKKIRVGNLLPAIILAVLIAWLFQELGISI